MAARLLHSIARVFIFGAFCAFSVLRVTGQTAQNTAPAAVTNSPPFTVIMAREEVPGMNPVTRTHVTVGTNKFALLTPSGYRTSADSVQRKVVIVRDDGRCSLNFRIAGPMPTGTNGLSAEPFRKLLLERHAGAKIVEEFTLTASGKSGPAFDLNWRTPGGLTVFTRTAFIPSEGGVLEFSLVSDDPDKAGELHSVFNAFLLTFRASRGGKIEITPLSNKN